MARDLLDDALTRVGYPVREIETLSETDTQVERGAVLMPTTADPEVLDQVVTQLEKAPAILSSTWSADTPS